MTAIRIGRPAPDEVPEYFARFGYLEGVPDEDAFAALERQIEDTARVLAGVDEARARFRYARGKWSIQEVVLHVSDSERVLAYRALRFARGDRTPLAGFDEEAWAPQSRADARSLPDLVAELRAVRAATVALFGSFDAERLARRGEARGFTVSVRALAWAIAGHERHHRSVLRERYGVGA